jgi:predicted Zn-dependent peptidase
MTRSLDAVMSFQERGLVDFGRRYLVKDRLVTASIVPGEVPVAERSGRIDALAGLGAPPDSPWASPAPELRGWSTETLPNGLTVWTVAREGGAPLSLAGLGFARGSASGAPGASATQLQRWQTVVPLSFADLYNTTATQTVVGVAPTATTVKALGPSGNLDAQLYLVRQLAVAPTLGPPPPPFVPGPVDPEAVARDDRLARLFPGHPLGAAETGSASNKEAAAWRDVVLRPDDAALVMAGWFDPAQAQELASTYLAKWKAGKGEPPMLPPLPAPPDRALVGVEADTTLASVDVACRVPGRIGVNDATIDVVQFLLEQGMSQSLRVRGGTYVADASVTDLGSQAGLLELTTAVGPGEAADALSSMYGLLELVAAGPSEGVLAWARQAVKGRFARSLASTRSSFDLALAAARSGMTLDQLRAYPSRVDAVDGAAVIEVLRGCVNHEATTYVGPETDLAPYEPTWR